MLARVSYYTTGDIKWTQFVWTNQFSNAFYVLLDELVFRTDFSKTSSKVLHHL